jgi:hypothetical protein
MSITVRDVNRSLRQTIWPVLREKGFTDRTDRVAWRTGNDGIDLIEITSIGADYDNVGCTSYSLMAFAAARLTWAPMIPAQPPLDRPHYWNCEPLVLQLRKTLEQPWFRPFKRPAEGLTPAMRLHREGLEHVLRHDTHDRADIWFILDDGSNLAGVLDDLTKAIVDVGLKCIDSVHRPEQVREMLLNGQLSPMLQSATGEALLMAVNEQLGRHQ